MIRRWMGALGVLVWLAGCADINRPPQTALLMGNWADPTVVKMGEDYYLTANNDQYVPSVMVFHSQDLFNWEPLGYASLDKGQGPATDIAAYKDQLYIYGGAGNEPWVMVANPPYRKWSSRINLQPLKPHGIDAGHIADEEGNRYLYTNQGNLLKITADGVRAKTPPKKVYDGWDIPENIAIECYCLESPKLFKRGVWYYMVSALGGTAGPATSHMAIVARSKQVDGPWENSPYNPLIWTSDASEPWWSKGHATLIEGRGGQWYAIYHGYPQGQRSLGRSTLISPVTWQEDAWPVLAHQWPSEWNGVVDVNWPMDDEFEGQALGIQWQALRELHPERYTLANGILEVKGLGTSPGDSFPISINPQHVHYEIETELVIEGEATAGLVLFYSPHAYVSLGLSHEGTIAKHVKRAPGQADIKPERRDLAQHGLRRVKLKLKNNRQDVSAYYMNSDGQWVKLERSDDISGFQHNIFGGFLSVRPGLFVNGSGMAKFNYFYYRGLD